MSLSPELEALLEDLTARGPASLDLDGLAEAIGTRTASYGEVEEMIDALEAAGVLVDGGEALDLSDRLAQVIEAARELSEELGRRPSVDEIAPRTGLDAAAVRQALRFAAVLSR